MTNIEYYPDNNTLTVFDWSTPTNPNPRLAAPISSTATTITFTSAPKDKDGNVITAGFLMGITNSDGYTERVYVPAGTLSADGLTATGVTRGIAPSGLDYTAGSSSFAADHGQDSAVSCVVDAFLHRAMIAALNGEVGTGGTNWKVGNKTDSDIYWYALNGDSNPPYFKYDKANNKFVFANDGSSEANMGGATIYNAGDGLSASGGDIDVDTTDTTIFKETTAGAGDSGKVPIFDSSGVVKLDNIESGSDVDQVCSGVGVTVTAAHLDALTDTSNAESLHTHTKIASGVGNISTGSIPGTTTITHGLGFTPKMILITAGSQSDVWSDGSYDGSNKCLYEDDGSNFNTNTTYAVYCSRTSGTDITRGAIGNSTTTQFDIVWSKVGTGINIHYKWTALA